MIKESHIYNIGRALATHGYCYCSPKDDLTPEQYKDLIELAIYEPDYRGKLEVTEPNEWGYFTIRLKGITHGN